MMTALICRTMYILSSRKNIPYQYATSQNEANFSVKHWKDLGALDPHCGKYLEDVCSSICDHGYSKKKEKNAYSGGKLSPSRSQKIRPHVHDACHQALNDAKFTVNSNGLKMKKKLNLLQVTCLKLFGATISLKWGNVSRKEILSPFPV